MGLMNISNRQAQDPKNLYLSCPKVNTSVNLIPSRGDGANTIYFCMKLIQKLGAFGLQKINRGQYLKNKHHVTAPKIFCSGLKLQENILRSEAIFSMVAVEYCHKEIFLQKINKIKCFFYLGIHIRRWRKVFFCTDEVCSNRWFQEHTSLTENYWPQIKNSLFLNLACLPRD